MTAASGAYPLPALSSPPAPCWLLQRATGEEYEGGEGVPHYDTYDEALREATRLQKEYEVERLFPVREPQPCWLVRCQTCGERLHPDYGLHAPSREDALQAAQDYEWQVINDLPYCDMGGCWHHAEEGYDHHAGAGKDCIDPACREAWGTEEPCGVCDGRGCDDPEGCPPRNGDAPTPGAKPDPSSSVSGQRTEDDKR